VESFIFAYRAGIVGCASLFLCCYVVGGIKISKKRMNILKILK
jgi:hypothetical protein